MLVVLCTWCEWQDEDIETKECPKCKTDSYLMDVEEGK
jgi:hypothetical protein